MIVEHSKLRPQVRAIPAMPVKNHQQLTKNFVRLSRTALYALLMVSKVICLKQISKILSFRFDCKMFLGVINGSIENFVGLPR